jgi:hypothetical protein
VSPGENVLGRLDRVRRSPNGWTARCPGPNHRRDDKVPSLSVAEGGDERALVYCFTGCTLEEITRGIGLEVSDLFTRDTVRPRAKAFPLPLHRLPRRLAEELEGRDDLARTWLLAKTIAPFDRIQAQRDLLTSWDRLEALGFDVPVAWRVAETIRESALRRYEGTREPWASRIRRFVRDVERGSA